jgi:hypothetical protein
LRAILQAPRMVFATSERPLLVRWFRCPTNTVGTGHYTRDVLKSVIVDR